jgi:transposase
MQVSTIGLDLAKNVFQVHGIDANEKVVVRKQLRRSQVMAFFEALPPCLIGMEACATGHHWARELRKLGHEVRLMPAKDVKAYVKRNKNDAADAEAICEAVRRPTMRFVTVKTVEQQGQLMQHRVRDQLMRQRTQLINALRSHMAELGIVADQGREGLKELLAIVGNASDSRLSLDARASLMILAAQLQACQTLIGTLEKRIIRQHKSSDRSRRLETIPGIGVIGATAIDATMTDPKGIPIGTRFCSLDRACPSPRFNGRQAEAWSHLKAGRPISATHPGRGCSRRPAARSTAPGEVSLAHRVAGATAVQDRGRGTRQQDGAHCLGLAGQRWNLSTATARGSRLMGLAMGRLR